MICSDAWRPQVHEQQRSQLLAAEAEVERKSAELEHAERRAAELVQKWKGALSAVTSSTEELASTQRKASLERRRSKTALLTLAGQVAVQSKEMLKDEKEKAVLLAEAAKAERHAAEMHAQLCDTACLLETHMKTLARAVEAKLSRLDQVMTKLAVRVTVLKGEQSRSG